MKKIGLVTVLYRSGEMLDDFFKSLKAASSPLELYVVDNNETDVDVAKLEAASKKYSVEYFYIPFGENRGVAKGNNIGIRMALDAGCDWIGIINNDIYFSEGRIFDNLVEAAERAKVDIAVPKITYFGTSKIWYGGGEFVRHSAITPHFEKLKEDSEFSSAERFTEYAPTCFMVVRSSVFEKIGFFHEPYFVYYDDTDWVYRYAKSGGKIFYSGRSSIAHKVSVSTGGELSEFSTFYSTRNRIYFVKRNYNFFWKLVFFSYFIFLRVPARLIVFPANLRKSYLKGLVAGLKMKIAGTTV